MKITSIKAQARNSQRVSVFVEQKYGFSLSLDELIKYGVKQNSELTVAELKKFKRISADGKLRAKSLEWLLNRPHSEQEFRDYLYRKKAEPEQINILTAEFTAKGYLDNTKFVAWYSELQARRGKSNRQIRAELYKKGIKREIAEDAVTNPGASETERLTALINKKSRLSRYQNNPRKLMQYLVSKGFDWQSVKEAINDNKLGK